MVLARGSKNLLLLSLLTTLMMAMPAAAAPPADDAAHAWTYSGDHGPDHWGGVCTTGKEQSPIDIVNPKKETLPAIDFSYHASPLKVVNNGHTIQVDYAVGSSIVRDGKTYELVQFHFHHLSENAIKGQHTPMELHLVHKDKDGNLAVVAVMLKEGKANQAVETVWSNLSAEEGKENAPASVTVDAAELVPHQARLLHLSGITDHSAMQRERVVAGAGGTDDIVEGTDRQIRRPVSRQRASGAAPERAAGVGEQVGDVTIRKHENGACGPRFLARG